MGRRRRRDRYEGGVGDMKDEEVYWMRRYNYGGLGGTKEEDWRMKRRRNGEWGVGDMKDEVWMRRRKRRRRYEEGGEGGGTEDEKQEEARRRGRGFGEGRGGGYMKE